MVIRKDSRPYGRVRSSDDRELVRETRESLAAVLGDEDCVLNPDTPHSGDVDSGFDREAVAFSECAVLGTRIVDIQP